MAETGSGENKMTENQVVDFVTEWLKGQGYEIIGTCHDTQRGDDIAASKSGSMLYVECKGALSKHGNELDSWAGSAFALFGAIIEVENNRPDGQKRADARHAIAVPDTPAYRKLFEGLRGFLLREMITVFLARQDKSVDAWWAGQ